MRSPFPGMDPYLEHPSLWPDVHNRLIAAIADAISPQVAPRYYVGLERRTYQLSTDDIVFVGRPDIAVMPSGEPVQPHPLPLADVGVMEVEVPVDDEAAENYLEVREVKTGRVVTVIELLSPANKLHAQGREEYEAKRTAVLRTRTNLVEIDLLRAGEPMRLVRQPVESDYRILISRGSRRPSAQLVAFNVRHAIPSFSLPLLPGDDEPVVDLGDILHALYQRARFDLRLDYTQPPVPALSAADADWAGALIASTR